MQISMFDGEKPYKINKPIRLIELFAGIGSQATALRNIGADFEHYRICEFDKYAVASYNAVHGTNFKTSDVTKISAKDLGITETDKYDYILTYSFPCQDLSLAGKQAGMTKGSGTRSGLLWEVERLLDECEELPQVLLMENVPQVHGTKNEKNFYKWIEKLESLGYRNYWQDLNAKDYGIPQNRERCFMVSVLGNYYYDFPKEIPLELRLKDMLESKVDEKYYLSEKGIKYFEKQANNRNETLSNIKDLKIVNLGHGQSKGSIQKAELFPTLDTRTSTAWHSVLFEPKCEVVAQLDGSYESSGRIYGVDGLCPTIRTMQGGNLEPKILQQPHGYNKGAELDTCPSITTSCWESNNLLKEPIIFDDFNQRVKADQTAINTLTTNCASSAERNGIKIIEPIIIDDIYNNREPREYGDTAPTLRSERQGLKVSENYRIRKLTPKECWRLMGFSDSDFFKAQTAGVSNSQLYKQAGNSIVVKVLEAILKQMTAKVEEEK